ncbi:MAG: sugar nucleotide-binding protein [Coriobacteriia bacterium]|nr:sugar nucleotide-binding protein [Coriobacteriia bacterium]
MRFLLLGSSGMAGHVISIYLKERGHDVVGFSRRSVDFVPVVCGDASDTALLEAVIQEGDFDIVVNAIGVLNESAESNKDEAVYLNSYLPHYLAFLTREMPTRVFHMSTDCVFAGNTGPYAEDSFPDGKSFYDRSKALGELNDNKNLTFRNSIIGPDINEKGIGLVNWFMKQTGPIKGFTRALWTGLTTLELAKVIECASVVDVTGLINMVPEENISKYDLLCLLNEHLRCERRVVIEPQDEPLLDKTLIRTNLGFYYTVPGYEEMVAEMAEWIATHRSLYPSYY